MMSKKTNGTWFVDSYCFKFV